MNFDVDFMSQGTTFDATFGETTVIGSNITVEQKVIEGSKNAVSGGAVKEYVDEQISNIEVPEGDSVDLSNYYTKEEIDNKGFITADDLPEIPEITIDSEMSDTSINAVQNKIIKAYVDAREQAIYKEVEKALKNCTTNDQFNAVVREVTTNYATKHYVDSVVGGIENGSY